MDLEDWFFLFALATSIYNAGYVHYLTSPTPAAGAKKKSNLNDDVVRYGILPRLPAKALLRLQCVSRKWHALISRDPYFVHLHSRQPPSSGGAVVTLGRIHLFDKPAGPVSINTRSVAFPPPAFALLQRDCFGSLVASCSGILCVVGRAFLFIGNPVLDDWVSLPFPNPSTGLENWVRQFLPNQRKRFGFGLAVEHASAVRYNLVFIDRFERDDGTKEFGFFVYPSRTRQWRLSSERTMVPHHLPIGRIAVYVKGCLYWMFGSSHVLWFDPNKERSGLRALPSDAEPNPERDPGMIGEWRDKLSYVAIKSKEIQVWSLEEVQSSSCWSKIHSISLEKISRGLRKKNKKHWEIFVIQRKVSLMPFQDGDIVSFFLEGAMYCYDMATEKVSKQADSKDRSNLFPYKDSLVYLPKHRLM